MGTRALAGALLWFVTLASVARAEPWPTLDQYVSDCVLILRARATPEVSANGQRTFEVIEAWVGEFRPSDFVDGVARGRTLRAYDGEHGVHVVAGQEIIFFYTRWNQPNEGLRSHSTAFPVVDGKVIYASTSDWDRQEMAVETFRRRIQAAVPATRPTSAPSNR
jgi:hypothetical protein